MEDGGYSVPIPTGSSQGLCPTMTEHVRSTTQDPVPGYDTDMTYLNDKGWWNIARPVDIAEDLMDLIQPLLTCESWDWHGAATAKALMKWAGLLLIIGLDENGDEDDDEDAKSWQKHGSDYQ